MGRVLFPSYFVKSIQCTKEKILLLFNSINQGFFRKKFEGGGGGGANQCTKVKIIII